MSSFYFKEQTNTEVEDHTKDILTRLFPDVHVSEVTVSN